jgi:hypothetical protein
MTRRRPSAVTILAVALGSMLLASLSLVLLFHRTVDRRWAEMDARCTKLRVRIAARGTHRPLLRGQPLPGDAVADYEAAIDAANRIPLGTPTEILSGTGPGDPESEREVLDYCRTVLDPLRRGVSRENYVPLKAGKPTYLGNVGDRIPVIQAAVCQARLLSEKDRRREASEVLMDACLFTQDLGAPTEMIPALAGLSDLLRSEKFSKEDSKETAREFGMLDSGFPRRAEAAERDLLYMGSSFLAAEGSDGDLSVIWGVEPEHIGWRHGFSIRLMKGEGFRAADRLCALLRRWDDLPWMEDCRESGIYKTRDSQDDDWIESRFEIRLVFFDDAYRGTLSQIRVLRVAAHFRATGELLDLPDPFGSRIQTRRNGDRLKVWSLGDVGSPAQERPNFKFHSRPDDREREIDLEVPR